MESGSGLLDLNLGVAVSLQSFAVRALLGSVVAALLAAMASRYGWLKSGRARRTLVMAPVVAAGAAAIACTAPGSSFLPALVVGAGNGQPFEIFGEPFAFRRLEWLLVAYAAITTFLLLRRLIGHWAISRYVAAAVRCDDHGITVLVRRVSSKLGISAPPVLLLRGCPGGAFTAGIRRPVIAVDRDLLQQLDHRELEGLIAHELAHIARRDVLLNTVVGTIRDLTFFIPPLNLASRWLRHEQEHLADDLASDSTGRPAALASSILKVWQGSQGSRRPQMAAMACATMVPAPALPIPVGMPTRLLRHGPLSDGAKQIAERVVRLIERGAPLSVRRQRIEMAVAMGAVILATAVTVVLPAQVQGELWMAQWVRPPAQPVESPAISSFRALAGDSAPMIGAKPDVVGHTAGAIAVCTDCVLLESGSDWRSQTTPALPARAPGWQDGGRVWQSAPEGAPGPPSAQPLWGVDSSGSRVGFFLVRGQIP
ncbi:MAG: M56 family metallopeptidase [Euzebya sp.]